MARLQLHIGKVYKQLEAIRNTIHREAAPMAQEARAQAPTDTGVLRNSIIRRKTAAGAEIVATADYAAYVEFLTAPFMRNAFEIHRDRMIKAIRNTLKNIK